MEKDTSAKLQLNFTVDGDLFKVTMTASSFHGVWYAPHMKLEDTTDINKLPDDVRDYILSMAEEHGIKFNPK